LRAVKLRRRRARRTLLSLLATVTACGTVIATDLNALVADRTAVERVYYNHRLGTKPPFDQAFPPPEIERQVKSDLRKEALLARVYHVEITISKVETELKRIDSETRAPEMLAEIKAALANDPARFARAVARPIVVDRELRNRFGNDDRLHAARRRQAEMIRENILAMQRRHDSWTKLLPALNEAEAGTVVETNWQLRPPPEGTAASVPTLAPARLKARSGDYSLEATVQFARPPSPAKQPGEPPHKSFENLSPEFRNVLCAQLQKSGDVSAVIETPDSFLLFVSKERTENNLSTVALSIPKLSFERWEREQKE